MTLESYFGQWLKVLNSEGKELSKILNILKQEYNTKSIEPSFSNVFKAFNLCPYKDLKVVMIGQDPYPQKGIATGILFGNRPDITEDKLSPSLKIIKEALFDPTMPDYNNIQFDNTLESWSKQGILLINSALTVETNKIGSHVLLWRPFIVSMLTQLSEINTGIIYVLFGKQAQAYKPFINQLSNTIIEEFHPAYYVRTNLKMSNRLFKQINKELFDKYKISINWYYYSKN